MTLDEYFQQSAELERECDNRRKQLDKKHTDALKENETKLIEEKKRLFDQVEDSPIGDIVEFTQLNGDRVTGLIVGVELNPNKVKIYQYAPVFNLKYTMPANALKGMTKLGHMDLGDDFLKDFV